MLKITLALVLLALLALGIALAVLKIADRRDDARAWAALAGLRAPDAPMFDPEMVADLPEIAQRYFSRAIAPGTPLVQVVELHMTGEFLLNGTPLPMEARQILAAPAGGFVWQAAVGQGLMRFSGSDGLLDTTGESWTRFGIWGVLPVARAGGTADHRRSAGTRAMMESVWAPAALLPQNGAHWDQIGLDRARVSFPALAGIAPMELTLDAQGRITEMQALRWSDANADHVYRLQPFGGRVLDSATFGGFSVPSRVEMGNHWGTADYAPFFRATIDSARY